MNLLTHLAHALRSAVKVNRALVATPAIILWLDAERNWQCAIPSWQRAAVRPARSGDHLNMFGSHSENAGT